MKLFSKPRRKMVLAVVLCGTALGIWQITTHTRNDVEWLTEPPGLMKSRLAFLGSWGQPVKRQLHRARYWLLGAPRTLTISGRIVELDSPTVLSNIIPTIATYSNSAGGQAWIIKDATAVKALTANRSARVLTAPTITVADGMPAQVSITDRVMIDGAMRDVGLRLDLSAHVRGDSVNLLSFLVATERATNRVKAVDRETNIIFVRTNAAFGARANLPKGSSLFLLASRGTNDARKVIGALLTPVIQGRILTVPP